MGATPNKRIDRTRPSIRRIDKASDSDLQAVLSVERRAFGSDEEADLVRDLLADPTAQPLLSLLAREDDRPVGHVLFTGVRLDDDPNTVSMALLAPLAIVPEAQRGVGLVFVLGHPQYYPRHGFEPAGRLGFAAPFPIPDTHADAWMVQALRPHLLGSVRGTVICADAVNKPKYWRE